MKITISGKVFFLALSVFALLSSCDKSTYSDELLTKARNVIENSPIDALNFLDSIRNPQEMGCDKYMLFIVTHVQAKYKTYQDVKNDTLIFKAQNYFNKKNNPDEAALAYFYAAIVYKENSFFDKALESFLIGGEFACKSQNQVLTGKINDNIGFIFYNQGMMDSAIVYYGQALSIYNTNPSTDLFKLEAINSIGSAYFNLNQLDSALFNYQKGLDLATKINNVPNIITFNHRLGVVSREKGEYLKASDYLHKALHQNTNSGDSIQIYLNLSKIFNKTNQLDSSKYYTDRIKERLAEIKNNYILRSVYGSISDYHYQSADYQQALHYKTLQMAIVQKIAEETNLENVMKAENKYRMYLLDQEYAAKRKQMLSINIIVVIIIIMTYLFCRKTTYKRQKKLEEKLHFNTQQVLYEHSIASKNYLETIYENFIIKWADIDEKVTQILLLGQEINLSIYVEIKSMVEELKYQTNEQLKELAKSYLYSHVHTGKKASAALTDMELVILMLCHLEYSESAIAIITGNNSRIFDLNESKLAIHAKLRNAGMSEHSIRLILNPEQL
ncbi:tetratricopeptide repeat protein [Dysgonomonas sp. ZJ709]|uniref:tetratricopeptide repeat protein n=1 Tax=Dysgonomonas sp. ZJ709 TaxID=2709797 RepID=UPI0013EA4687|nr:tetratricopeptide repeat protein [Dysgonomonas sp. ZJ709]